MPVSLFADTHDKLYTRYTGQMWVGHLVAGTPSDPKVAEGWIKKNLGAENPDLIREAVVTTMLELGIPQEEAVDEVVKTSKLNRFKRDENGLYIEGRQLKAAIKEAANISWPKRRWGPSSKGTIGFWSEHVFVTEDRLYLGLAEPTGVQQRFVHAYRGHGIQYEEFAEDVKLSFTIKTDVPNVISDQDWAEMWTRGENQGIGAVRSQGYGRYVVTQWEREERIGSPKEATG